MQELHISHSNPKVVHLEASVQERPGLFQRARGKVKRTLAQRRFVRYGLLSLNVALLAGIIIFVAQSSPTGSTQRNLVASSNADAPADPLDQPSSADIALNLAQMTNLAETQAVTNQAQSASTELSSPTVQTVVVAKPQTVVTDLKSRKDITSYTAKPGDTVASIAAQFSVTSESILWSNNITGNAVTPGAKLLIPPVSGIVYTVKEGDSPDTLAQKYRASKDQIIAYNDAELSGLKVGEQIIIPNGQVVAPTRSSYALVYGGVGSFSATYGYNGYDYGFCTWFAADHRNKIGRPLPSNLGDAWTWDDRAAAAGLKVNNTPAYGAAVVTNTSRRPGHVAFVEAVNADGSVWISEMNSRGQRSMTDSTPYGGWGKVDYKLIAASQARSYNYIH